MERKFDHFTSTVDCDSVLKYIWSSLHCIRFLDLLAEGFDRYKDDIETYEWIGF